MWHPGLCGTQVRCDFSASVSPWLPRMQPLLLSATSSCSWRRRMTLKHLLWQLGCPSQKLGCSTLASPRVLEGLGRCWPPSSGVSCAGRVEMLSLQASRALRSFLISAAHGKNEKQEPSGDPAALVHFYLTGTAGEPLNSLALSCPEQSVPSFWKRQPLGASYKQESSCWGEVLRVPAH